MKQKKRTYTLFLIIHLLITATLAQAGNEWYNSLPDSSRALIRQKAHVVLHLENLSTGFADSLILKNIPVALYAERQPNSIQLNRIRELIRRQQVLPVIIQNTRDDQFTGTHGLVFIKSGDYDLVYCSHLKNDALTDSLFSFNELTFVIPWQRNENDASTFYRIWQRSGKMPNFIEPGKNNAANLIHIVDSLNSIPKIYGVVKTDKGRLTEVYWKGRPNCKTLGYFCFPLGNNETETFIPYKPGYRFSPDIIHDAPGNRKYMKEFKAIPLNKDFGLTDHFIFDNQVLDPPRNNKKEIINNGVKFIHDRERGNCAWFPGRAYIDAGLQSAPALRPDFSITAWVKPLHEDENNSIIGKGKDFVLKLQYGVPTYTMQGIKDYRSLHAKVPVNQWSFIALVHSSYESRISFFLNGKLTDQIRLIAPYTESDYTLVIGSNLWEEFFNGYIDDIKIWSRELNEDEIRLEYISSLNDERSPVYTVLIYGLAPVLALIAVLLLIRLRKKRSRRKKHKKNMTVPSSVPANKTNANGKEKIVFFGGLKVINSEGTDVSRKFSPRLKQLFVLIFLYSSEGMKGITTQKLSGILWPGMSPQEAKNTRGTNIQNLKAALASCSGIKLTFRDKLWFIEPGENCWSDYHEISDRLSFFENRQLSPVILEKELPGLLGILKQGTMLPNMSESWLDPYISKINDRIIELGIRLFPMLEPQKNAALLDELAGVVSLYDPLNEPALKIKLNLFTMQGKLSLARSEYDHFAKLYQELYQEPYPTDFRSMIQEETNSVK